MLVARICHKLYQIIGRFAFEEFCNCCPFMKVFLKIYLGLLKCIFTEIGNEKMLREQYAYFRRRHRCVSLFTFVLPLNISHFTC